MIRITESLLTISKNYAGDDDGEDGEMADEDD